MEYDFTKRPASTMPPHGRATPATTVAASSMYGQSPSLYPKVGVAGSHSTSAHIRNPPFHHAPPPPSSNSSSGVGVKVSVKPEYRITAPPSLLPQTGEIPRSNFQFDFEFERIVLAEAVKENPNWSRLGIENVPPKAAETSFSYSSSVDPVVSKYIAAGLSREAVPLAVANYGDNPAKVKEFSNGYSLLREMGFSSDKVVEALMMYDNDTEKALSHFLNNTS